MKRKITDLEQKMLEKGWVLDHKTYRGKHSQFVDKYVYYKDFKDGAFSWTCKCELNYKREKVECVYIFNMKLEYISLVALNILSHELYVATKELEELSE